MCGHYSYLIETQITVDEINHNRMLASGACRLMVLHLFKCL